MVHLDQRIRVPGEPRGHLSQPLPLGKTLGCDEGGSGRGIRIVEEARGAGGARIFLEGEKQFTGASLGQVPPCQSKESSFSRDLTGGTLGRSVGRTV